jgi:hypothetical protein
MVASTFDLTCGIFIRAGPSDDIASVVKEDGLIQAWFECVVL